MTMVKFASTCDVKGPSCHRRSEEYTEFPTCRECGNHVCPPCSSPGSMQEVDRDRDGEWGVEAVYYETVLCPPCAVLLAEADTPTATPAVKDSDGLYIREPVPTDPYPGEEMPLGVPR